MLHDFNLLITTTRHNEHSACSETWYLLNQIGDRAPQVDKTGILGLITAKTTYDPQEAIQKLRTLLKQNPHEFRYTLRIIPIQKVVETTQDKIAETATQLATQIQPNETFRITIEKRHTNIPTETIIEATAANINRKVNLTTPDKTILIEIVGPLTGISILKPNEIISTVKEKLET
jgi:tRNA acetyltransferase TAN1